MESFLGFLIEELARRVQGPLYYSSALSFLRQVQKEMRLPTLKAMT
jgi:hypothetical protein